MTAPATAPRTNGFSRWFALEEFAVSASHPALVAPVPTRLIRSVRQLARTCLDPIRDHLGKPWTITSGYRSPALNRAVGGSPTTQHVAGEAADGRGPTPADTRRVFDAIVAGRLVIPAGQVIYYPDQHFVHVALPSSRYPTLTPCVHSPPRHLSYRRVHDLATLGLLIGDAPP